MADHPPGYVKGCSCERCERQRQRSREYAKTYKHPDPQKRRKYQTVKQREYATTPKGKRVIQAKAERDRLWREANPDAVWAHSLKANHGIRPEQWHAMWVEQDGKCYLCERSLPDDRAKVAVDHDHQHCPQNRSCRYCRRGLAHHGCNTAIGLVGEDSALLRLIADNLDRAKVLMAESMTAVPIQDQLTLGI
jgi:Recombination endonuclease VII